MSDHQIKCGKGFSLVELMIVIATTGVIVAIRILMYLDKESFLREDLKLKSCGSVI